MAAISCTTGCHKTLSTTTVDTVTFAQTWGRIEITNLDGTTKLYCTFNGATPTAGGDDTTEVMTSASKIVSTLVGPIPGGNVVKIIGNGNVYSVEGVD